jgi:glutamate/tyrosine decarboxylase-like PLP-dependent enzyme
MDQQRAVLERVLAESLGFLAGLPSRPVNARADVDEVAAALGGPLPADASDPLAVIDELVAGAEPGVVAMPSPRFFGWVIGGVLPAALGADWLTSLWDQNAGLLVSSPAAAGAERVAGDWLLDLLGLPTEAAVGFVTGGMMANFTCLAAARGAVLRRVGWDVEADGLLGCPRVRVLVGRERHDTIDLSLRLLGLGAGRAIEVDVDEEGRIVPAALAAALDQGPADAATIVCLQAGNVHSGAYDPFDEAIAIARRHGAWVHVDGAFGLWAAASPTLRPLLAGAERADSWATDAHKTLNVPYDNGIAIVADATSLHTAMGVHAAYLIQDSRPDPMATVPEFSRRARGFTVWAALRSLGRTGVASMVDGLVARARRFADRLGRLDGVEIVNDVVFTQVCVSFGPDAVTREVARRLLADGTAWMTPSTWRGRAVLRISVSNHGTTDADVDASVAALIRILDAVRADQG